MVGLHHGLTPIHMEFINQTHVTPLLPVLAMAGAGQVGANCDLCENKTNDFEM